MFCLSANRQPGNSPDVLFGFSAMYLPERGVRRTLHSRGTQRKARRTSPSSPSGKETITVPRPPRRRAPIRQRDPMPYVLAFECLLILLIVLLKFWP
jgi:hypothetical protein